MYFLSPSKDDSRRRWEADVGDERRDRSSGEDLSAFSRSLKALGGRIQRPADAPRRRAAEQRAHVVVASRCGPLFPSCSCQLKRISTCWKAVNTSKIGRVCAFMLETHLLLLLLLLPLTDLSTLLSPMTSPRSLMDWASSKLEVRPTNLHHHSLSDKPSSPSQVLCASLLNPHSLLLSSTC